MKTRLFFVVFGLILALLPMASADTQADAANSSAKTTTVEVEVFGMVCSFCAQGIEKKFSARPEIKGLDVKLKDRRVFLHFKDGQKMTDDMIQSLFAEAGYKAKVLP